MRYHTPLVRAVLLGTCLLACPSVEQEKGRRRRCLIMTGSSVVSAIPILLLSFCLEVPGQVPRPKFYFIGVPAQYETNKSPSRSNIPLNNYGPIPFNERLECRYQQVYNASDFSRLPPGGAFISTITFRDGCGSLNAVTFSNRATLTINLSTTAKAADGLSSLFSENLGSDQTTVFLNRLSFFSTDIGPCNDPQHLPSPEWGDAIQLDPPFFYNPSHGNLLLEMYVPVGALSHPDYTGFEKVTLETATGVADSVSRVAASKLSSQTADLVDSVGLVTQFIFVETPKLSVSQNSGKVTVSWLEVPEQFHLQVADSLKANAVWKDQAGPYLHPTNYVSALEFPVSSLTRTKYYRLFWNSPQPGLPKPAVVAVPGQGINNP